MLASTQVWVIFAVSVACMLTTGTQYGLSAWSPQLKQELNCTQSDIELLGEIGNLGPYLGPLTGTLVYVLSEQWVCIVGTAFAVAGYILMSIVVPSTPGSALYALRSPGFLGFSFACAGFGAGVMYNLLLQARGQMHMVTRCRCVFDQSGLGR